MQPQGGHWEEVHDTVTLGGVLVFNKSVCKLNICVNHCIIIGKENEHGTDYFRDYEYCGDLQDCMYVIYESRRHCLFFFLVCSSQSSRSVRHSSRKRKVNEAHPSPSTDTTAENARSLVEMLLGMMAEMVLTGLVDRTLELGCAHFAGQVTETGTHTDKTCLTEHCRCIYIVTILL